MVFRSWRKVAIKITYDSYCNTHMLKYFVHYEYVECVALGPGKVSLTMNCVEVEGNVESEQVRMLHDASQA